MNTDNQKADGSELLRPSCSPRSRMLALTAAGCFRQWQPGLDDDGYYRDTAYIYWMFAEKIIQKWGFEPEECDMAWAKFRQRHGENYPGGDWQQSERVYLDLLENSVIRCHSAERIS